MWYSSHIKITFVTCDTRHKPGNTRHMWYSPQTKSHALYVTLVTKQEPCATCDIGHKTRSHALHVTLVTNQITCVTCDICHISPHVTHNRQRRNGCMVCHADMLDYQNIVTSHGAAACRQQQLPVGGTTCSSVATHWQNAVCPAAGRLFSTATDPCRSVAGH
jgi:hypothetical protein